MPTPASGAIPARNGRQRPNLAVLQGGRRPEMVFVAASVIDEQHAELVAARAERTIYAARVHDLIRQVARHLATSHFAAAGTSLLEMERLTVQEQDRARAMDAAACPDGSEGSGHGPAETDALALPTRRAA